MALDHDDLCPTLAAEVCRRRADRPATTDDDSHKAQSCVFGGRAPLRYSYKTFARTIWLLATSSGVPNANSALASLDDSAPLRVSRRPCCRDTASTCLEWSRAYGGGRDSLGSADA